MSGFTLHDKANAPEASRTMLEDSEKAFGMIPNLHRAMAESPELLDAYKHLHNLFLNTSLTPTEQNVVWLTINIEHACHYCVPAHTAIAHSMKIDAGIIEALRKELPLEDFRLEALRQFTLQVVRKRGAVTGQQVDDFIAAGYSRKQVLEVLLGVAQKVMSNYLNHIVETPVDEPFKRFAWQRNKAA
jgi:uncharacterized peroxidase-related enzyme